MLQYDLLTPHVTNLLVTQRQLSIAKCLLPFVLFLFSFSVLRHLYGGFNLTLSLFAGMESVSAARQFW